MAKKIGAPVSPHATPVPCSIDVQSPSSSGTTAKSEGGAGKKKAKK